MSESAVNPLNAKSGSEREINSSSSGTRWCNCVLMPHSSASPKGGTKSRMTVGRYLFWPSACESAASATSPTFMTGFFPNHIERVLRFVFAVSVRQTIRGNGVPILPLGIYTRGDDANENGSVRRQMSGLIQNNRRPIDSSFEGHGVH